ncbi:MAG: sel1 repeat family protein [Synergistaceae bacterium]|nr:sel1 repeat family protein [Synergistaceae bacterium]
MRQKIISAVLSLAATCFWTSSSFAAQSSGYDPVNTLSALNMAIVSVHRITTTEDRVILDYEYRNIINNLKLGNIEDDPEIRELYKDLMGVIGGKTLRREEAERFNSKYDAREKNRFVNLLSSVRGPAANPWSFIGALLAGEVTAYFGASDPTNDVRAELDDELWKLERENIEECAALQKRLLDSSWTLLRRYALSDDYRLAQSDLDDFDKAIREPDGVKSLRMFRALEPHFKVYAPFWYYYGTAAQKSGDAKTAERCFAEFERMWRPVLRQDPYRAEAAKYRAGMLSGKGASSEDIATQLAIITENTPRENWMNNLYAGVMYYSIGEREKGIDRVSVNIDFDVERDISATVLRDMESGALDPELFADDVQSTIIAYERGLGRAGGVTTSVERGLIAWFKDDKPLAAQLLSAGMGGAADPVPYHALLAISQTARDVKSLIPSIPNAARLKSERDALASATPQITYGALLPIVERYAATESQPARIFLGDMYYRGLGVSKDIAEAVKLFTAPAESGAAYAQAALGEIFYADMTVKDDAKASGYFRAAADQGIADAQMRLGDMYKDGLGLERNLEDAYMWYYLASLNGDPAAQSRLDDLDGKGFFKGKSVSGATARRAKERARKIYDAAVAPEGTTD